MALSRIRATEVVQKAARTISGFGRTQPGVVGFYNSSGLTFVVIETRNQATDDDLARLSKMLRADDYIMVNETVVQFSIHPRSWIC